MASSPSDPLLRDLTHEVRLARSIARAVLHDEHLAEDAVQEGWSRALSHPPERTTNPGAWFVTIVKRIALDRGRADRRRAEREQRVAHSEVTVESDERERSFRAVTTAVLTLDEPYRRTILARYFEGLPPRAIARQEGVPVATVSSRLQRGMSRLRERLFVEYGDDRAGLRRGLLCLAGPSGAGGLLISKVLIMSLKAKALVVSAIAVLAIVGTWLASEPSRTTSADSPVVGSPIELTAPTVDDPTAVREPVVAAAEIENGVAPQVAAQPESVPANGTRLVVHATFESDGAPAANVGIKVVPWDANDWHVGVRRARTDAAGAAIVEGLPASRITVYADRGGTESGKLELGVETELALVIPAGATFDVVVHDELARPVSDAGIWLSAYGNDTDGDVIGDTDASGRFVLRDVRSGCYLGATKKGFLAAPLARLEALDGERKSLELRMGQGGGSLSGRVVDSGGVPVARALVRLTQRRNRPEGVREWAGLPTLESFTGRDGRFGFEGVEPFVILEVREPNFVASKQDLGVQPGAALEVEVKLEHGCTVKGVARGADGAPLSGVDIHTQRFRHALSASSARSAADGSYELTGVPSGDVELHAEGVRAGEASTTLRIEPGTPGQWDPVLSSGLEITGVALDERGVPVKNLLIYGRFQDWRTESLRTALRSDAAGRFVFSNLEPAVYRFELRLDDDPFPLATVEKVRPGDSITLRVDPSMLPTNEVFGRVVGADGAPVEGDVYVRRDGNEGLLSAHTVAASGAFTFPLIPAGTYRLAFEHPSLGYFDLAEIVLTESEKRDLGAVTLPALGTLAVDLVAADGIDPAKLWLRIQRSQGGRPIPWEKLPARVDVPPGTYMLQLFGDADGKTDGVITIAAGQLAAVSLAARRGSEVKVVVRLPATDDVPRSVHVTLLDDDGLEIDSWSDDPAIADRQFASSREFVNGVYRGFAATREIANGDYHIVATTTNGLVGTQWITIDGPTTVDVSLRRP